VYRFRHNAEDTFELSTSSLCVDIGDTSTSIDLTVPLTVLFSNKMYAFNY
jgi:hypothetical protein